MPGFAITDHGNLTAHRETYNACLDNGVIPILGVEAYFTPDRHDKRARKDRLPDDKIYNHIILLGKNNQGLDNISRMSEVAWKEGFYHKPRIDYEVLEEYQDGVIVVSGCMNGVISQLLLNGKPEEAYAQAQYFKAQFGDDFYMELQPHNPADLNKGLLEVADRAGVKSVLTLDCHYASPDQRVAEEVMLAIGTNLKMEKGVSQATAKRIPDILDRLDYLYGDRPMSFKDMDLYLMDRAEAYDAMEDQGILREDIFENTLEVMHKIEDYDIPFQLPLLPIEISDPDATLAGLARAGLMTRGLSHKEEYIDRLEEELEIIKNKDFSPYFLIVADMIKFAKDNEIMVGPGRGSSAGSLVCYALGITEIDPIEHNLLFFRFIDAEREDWPDIDTDIEDRRRNEVKEYLTEKYGNVASIATYTSFKDKSAIKDVARVFGVPFAEINNVLKGVDTWEEFTKNPRAKAFIAAYPEVMEYAEDLLGRVKSTGIHPAGIVVSKVPINEVAPLEHRKDPKTDERIPVVALDMKEVADVGLIKIDALGLNTLSVLSETLKTIKRRRKKTLNLLDIDMNDPKVYAMLSEGKTKGVFQAEQPAYTSLLRKMGVQSFNDLAVSNALVRPGAMNTIGKEYIARKNGDKKEEYMHEDMRAYTHETYGLHVYQEQVMLTCIEIAGMSKGEANHVRKIIGKKMDPREFDMFKTAFIEGASKKITTKQAEKLWSDFEAHAGYSFNKSHAVAYSMLTYWTAYLKLYYPLEFFHALLMNETDKDSRMEYIIEAKSLGIDILLPHINNSEIDFAIQGEKIRIGLSAVKFISDAVASKIIAGRPYESYAEFVKRASVKYSGINSRAIANLNLIGAASFEDNPKRGDERSHLYDVLGLPEFTNSLPDWVVDKFNATEEVNEKDEFLLFGMVKEIKRGKGWARVEIIDETGSVGVFDQEHTVIEPGKVYVVAVAKNSIVTYSTSDEIMSGKGPLAKYLMSPKALCKPDERYVVAVRTRKTKAGGDMATVLLADDMTELDSALVFDYNFKDVIDKLKPGKAIKPVFNRTKDGALTIKEIR